MKRSLEEVKRKSKMRAEALNKLCMGEKVLCLHCKKGQYIPSNVNDPMNSIYFECNVCHGRIDVLPHIIVD